VKPLQWIATGMVVVLVLVLAGDVDLLANPLGWVLVVVGLRALPADLELRTTLLWVAGLAAVVSVPLWVPGVLDALDDADESVAWAVNVPQFACYLLLAHALSHAAATAGEKVAAAWWRAVVIGLAGVIALPVLIFGGGLDGLEGLAGVLVGLVPAVMIVLLLTYAGRGWAGAASAAEPAEPAS
jgi:hypothetical protein